jgi:hypothetical protein
MPSLAVVIPPGGHPKRVPLDEAKRMLAAGELMQPQPRSSPAVFYETRELSQPPEDLDSVLDEEEEEEDLPPEQTYKTRDMRAEAKPVSIRRRRKTRRSRPTVDDPDAA